MVFDMKSVLRQNSRLVSRSLVVSDLLLLDLHDIDFIKDNIDDINRQTPADMRVTILVEILNKVPDHQSTAVFDNFLAALRRDGQEHVANIFSLHSDARPMSDEHCQLLISRKKEICKFLDPLNGVLDELVTCGALSYKDSSQVRAQRGLDEMARKTIDILIRKADSAFDLFITALQNTGQQHVATIIEPDIGIQPMSAAHRQLLLAKRNEICRYLDSRTGVLDELFSCGVFSDRDSSQVKASQELDEMARETIDILSRKADRAFDLFITTLHNTGQEHVAALLRPDTSTIPMSDEHRQLLISKKAQLTKCFYVDRSVTAELSSNGIINSVEEERVNNIDKGPKEMALKVIDIVTRKPDSVFYSFCKTLGQIGQEHVLYVLTGNGSPPLSRIRAKVLAELRDLLVQKIDMEASFRLTGILASSGSISDANKQLIETQPTCERRCEVLLDIMACKSNSAYDTFLKALKDTGQQHIVTALDGVEVKAIVHTYFRHDLPDDVRSRITDIVRQNMKKLCGGVEPDIGNALAGIMEQNGFVLSDVRAGSILVTFRCYGADSLDNLIKLIADRTLDKMFYKTFCMPNALTEQGLERLEVIITDEELQKCAEQFHQMALMSTLHTEALDQTAEQFSDKKIVTRQLLDCLNLSDDQKDAILSSSQMTKTLFRAVSQRPDVTFFQFLDVLGDSEQHQIAKYLMSYRSFSWLSVELLELVLMRTFTKQFTGHLKSHSMTPHEAIAAAYSALSAVCYNWWQTMSGWPQSNTRHWLRHQLQHSIHAVCRPYSACPRLHFSLIGSHDVRGVAQCDNKLFVVCEHYDTIDVFGRDNKPETDISVRGLKRPQDIVACTDTKQLYISDGGSDCVWRVSLDGQRVDKWLTNKSTSTARWYPYTLSLTSGRLLVTSEDVKFSVNNSLYLFGSDGVELKHIPLSNMWRLRHAVETSRGTFVICYDTEPQTEVSEVNVDGHVIRVCCDQQQLDSPCYLALDSDDRVLVADPYKNRVLLLNNRLELERVLLDTQHHQLVESPWRLCYVEEAGQLVVSSKSMSCDLIQVYRIRDSSNMSSAMSSF